MINNMRRLIIPFIICALLLMSSCSNDNASSKPNTVAATETAALYETEADGNGLMITAYKGKETKVNIPAEIDGKGIISIGWSAFSGCDYITDITVPDTVKKVGLYAFSGCTALVNVKLSQTIEILQSGAFENCTSLEKVNLPASLNMLGIGAFIGCSNLKEIIAAPESEYFTTDEHGVLYNKKMSVLIWYPAGKPETEYHVPSGVIEISDRAFQNCINLKSVTLPDGLIFINDYAFNGCSSLQSLNIPVTASEIGGEVFDGCPEGIAK